MKPGRQSVILQIISTQEIETQNQLLLALAEHGVKSTQATLSRDIKDMRLVKELSSNGHYKYVVSTKPEADDGSLRLNKILRESVVSYDTAQNLLVIRTLPGLASAVCSAIDNMGRIEKLVGTIAGDDTAFVAMKDNAGASNLYSELERLLLK